MKNRIFKIIVIMIIICLLAYIAVLSSRLTKANQIKIPIVLDYEGSQGEYIPPDPGSVKRSQNITLPG